MGAADEAEPSAFLIRRARREDVPAIVRMLADDALGSQRERYAEPLPEAYWRAFEQIDADPAQELVVVEDRGRIAGTLQLTFLTYLTYQGGVRAQIEGVRIAHDYRGQGLGRIMFEWAIGRARARGCHVVQLTADKKRPEAHRFYEALGFKPTHEGMKLHLS